MGKNVHVLPDGNQWKVKTENSERAFRKTDTQKEAIEIAREVARNQQSELIIHRPNGQIRQKDSHGNDDFPPRG